MEKHVNFINTNNQSSKLANIPKKTLVKLGAVAFLLTASTISSSLLAASSHNTPLWLSKTVLHKPIGKSYFSTLKSVVTFPIFDDVSTRHLADDDQPNYTKAVVLASIRWVFGERSEWESKNKYVDVQMQVSIVIALHNSGTPNKMAIFLAYVQNDILQEMDKSNKKVLDMLDKAALAKEKKLDKEFEDRQAFMQMARLRQVEASMKQYAALNDEAYQLGFETFNRIKDIDVSLNIPIHQRQAFKTGVEVGKHSYDLSVADRGLINPPETDKPPISSESGLIEADNRTNKDEIKLNLSDFEK
ncbi:hypothetical protein [Paraglaciecola sp. MB-3u-78]|uniref:hypothetical protein n=1 Tax=Paraglaciecola sp. MB-3u-78 TaxID=2058332 RepID=UPI000C335198|nr:hypothetical protein [Paraglaciecola sp. MB-3u-78]PKG96102.1 hypothetical protein CXF95_24420 [Paraglaciecola sp. MB-3u-78]